jgi:hypothetical protein
LPAILHSTALPFVFVGEQALLSCYRSWQSKIVTDLGLGRYGGFEQPLNCRSATLAAVRQVYETLPTLMRLFTMGRKGRVSRVERAAGTEMTQSHRLPLW